VSADPKSIALDATYQIDALLEMLGKENGQGDFTLLLKAVLPRLTDLNAFVMWALDPADDMLTPEMMKMVDPWAAKAVQS
jgi:hypothetical protein